MKLPRYTISALGLIVLPTIVSSFLAISSAGAPLNISAEIPKLHTYGAFACMPVCIAIVGIFLVPVAEALRRWRHWRPAYTTTFIVLWNMVFVYLSLFLFGMAFLCAPIRTVQNLDSTLVQTIVAFPNIVSISMIVCVAGTALVAMIWKLSGRHDSSVRLSDERYLQMTQPGISITESNRKASRF